MNTARQRENWDGDPLELGDAWILRKGEKVARCILVTHPLGWELRLMTSDLLRSQVCRSSARISYSLAPRSFLIPCGDEWARPDTYESGLSKVVLMLRL